MANVTGSRYEISGSKTSRIAKHSLISLFVKYEDYCGGPGIKFIALAFLVHYFGRIYGWLRIRFEKQARLLTGRIRPR